MTERIDDEGVHRMISGRANHVSKSRIFALFVWCVVWLSVLPPFYLGAGCLLVQCWRVATCSMRCQPHTNLAVLRVAVMSFLLKMALRRVFIGLISICVGCSRLRKLMPTQPSHSRVSFNSISMCEHDFDCRKCIDMLDVGGWWCVVRSCWLRRNTCSG